MNKLIKRTYVVVLTFIMVMAMSIVVLAQGTTSIAVTKGSIGVGDKTTVTVTASASGTVTVKYTASLMNLEKCSASGYSSEGNTITFKGTSADLVFSAKDAGTASIIVSSSSCSGSSTTISISGQAAASTEAAEEPKAEATTEESSEADVDDSTEEPVAETEETATATDIVGVLNDQGGFDVNGFPFVVSERYTDAEIPDGFSKLTVKIGSSTYNELSNGSITLLYMKPSDKIEESGYFFIYDAEAKQVTPFTMLGTGAYYVIASNPPFELSNALVETTVQASVATITAYSTEGSNFLYVYGEDNKGFKGWFVYDKDYGTVARADESVFYAVSTVNDDEIIDSGDNSTYDSSAVYKDKIKKLRRIISIMVILWVLVIFYLINLIIRKKNEEDDDKDEIFANHRPINFFTKKEDEDEEAEDEDDDIFTKTEKANEVVAPTEKKQTENSKNSAIDMMDLNDL